MTSDALANLRESGLTEETIKSMQVRMATVNDGIRSDQSGYVIPYFVPDAKFEKYSRVATLDGPFTRIRLLNNNGGPKYLQGRNTGTHIYLPPNVETELWGKPEVPLIITEGEKKAAAAAQYGFVCAAVSGVDAWRSHRLTVPQTSVVNTGTGGAYVTITLEDSDAQKIETQVADELTILPLEGRQVYIIFDADMGKLSTIESVQRAAFDLGFWVETNGGHVAQVHLPFAHRTKVALDDFLQDFGPEGLEKALKKAKFPHRPKLKSWVQKELSRSRPGRHTFTKVARAILANLDRRGIRYRDDNGRYYYFDKQSNVLYEVPFMDQRSGRLTSTTFDHFLISEFGISSSDRDVTTRVKEEMEALPPILHLRKVYRTSTTMADAFYYQLSDSEVVKVTAGGIETIRNGDDQILFVAGNNDTKLVEPPKDFRGWLDVIDTTTIQPMPALSVEETRALAACLAYINPWLRRWRGMMLPVEVATGEAGSGKSSMFQLRKAIFSGSTRLNKPPRDLNDWYAVITNEHGMWVGDNMGHHLDDVFSNEIARLVTDYEPAVEKREYYTTSDVSLKQVDCTFAFTTIYRPVTKPDLIQRSLIFPFASVSATLGEAEEWVPNQLNKIGRDAWLAHHFEVLHRFFIEATAFDFKVASRHRLVLFEAVMRCMGRALGIEPLVSSAMNKLPTSISEAIVETDPVMSALDYFVRNWQGGDTFFAADVYRFFQDDLNQEFTGIDVLRTTFTIGNYLNRHASDVRNSVGIVIDGKRGGRQRYRIGEK